MNLNVTPINHPFHQYHLQQTQLIHQQHQINQALSSASPSSNSSTNSFSSSTSSPYPSPLQLVTGQQLAQLYTINAAANLKNSQMSNTNNSNSLKLTLPNNMTNGNSNPNPNTNTSPVNGTTTPNSTNTTKTATPSSTNLTETVSGTLNTAQSNTNSPNLENQTNLNNSPISNASAVANGSVTFSPSVVPSSVYSYNSNNLTKPEAKKAKTQRSQPSKVVHIRNIPQQITEIEIIQFGLIFGNIANVLNLRSKCQAFLEFEKCEEAQSMINYFANNPISVAGRQIFVQYSNYKNLVTDPSNTNNQVAKAALDLAKDLHKAAQTGGQNTVLRAMIQNMLYGVTLDTIYQIFNRFGPVLKIITFTKNDKFQALIQMKDATCAQAAKTGLHGQNIYNSCCTLHIDYSKLNTLNVKYNNEKSRDYTNPLLPAGDCPDHLALGPGGIINGSMQLSLAAAAAAAGYASPFTTTIPAGYHLAPAANPFLSYTTGKYLPQQAIINASGLLQTTSGATNLATQTRLGAATHLSQQSSNPNQSALTTAAIAAAYSLNQAQQQQQQQQHHHHQQQQQQHQQHLQQTLNGHANGLSQGNTINGMPPPQAVNGNAIQTHNGAMLLPFLQNLSDDVRHVYVL